MGLLAVAVAVRLTAIGTVFLAVAGCAFALPATNLYEVHGRGRCGAYLSCGLSPYHVMELSEFSVGRALCLLACRVASPETDNSVVSRLTACHWDVVSLTGRWLNAPGMFTIVCLLTVCHRTCCPSLGVGLTYRLLGSGGWKHPFQGLLFPLSRLRLGSTFSCARCKALPKSIAC